MVRQTLIRKAERQKMNTDQTAPLDHHSETFLKMALQTQRRRRIDKPDGYGRRTGECGDTVEFFLLVRKGTIDAVFFEIDGCLNTNACANTVAHMAEGKSIEDAWHITPEHIIDYLKTLPPQDHHCAELAAGAFYLALKNAGELQRSPWKKIYQ